MPLSKPSKSGLMWGGGARECSKKCPDVVMGEAAFAAARGGLKSVSYTHLDVYKRQLYPYNG